MPFQIIRNDISKMHVDAIVNTANPRPVIGEGTDSTIHAAAGPELLKARQAIGPLRPGEAAITPGFHLPADYVIHTVGPVWRGGLFGEARTLRRCYDRCLALAAQKGCQSIAFPLISTGTYRFPQDKALRIAQDAIRDFLKEQDMLVYLVVFNREAFRLSEEIHRNVASYIDEKYVQELARDHYHAPMQSRETSNRFPIREESQRYAPEPESDSLFAGEMAPEPDDNIPEEAPFSSRRSTGALPDLRDADSCPASAKSAPQAPRPRREEVRHSPARRIPGLSLPDLLPKPAEPAKSQSLTQWLEQTDAGFSETLLKLIDRTGKKDSEIYNKANISRQHFSKIRNNPAYNPTKTTAVAFAIALELDLEQTRDLIGRAGYALTRSSKFDLIIMYFIENRNYNLYDINMALFEFDQSLLGA